MILISGPYDVKRYGCFCLNRVVQLNIGHVNFLLYVINLSYTNCTTLSQYQRQAARNIGHLITL